MYGCRRKFTLKFPVMTFSCHSKPICIPPSFNRYDTLLDLFIWYPVHMLDFYVFPRAAMFDCLPVYLFVSACSNVRLPPSIFVCFRVQQCSTASQYICLFPRAAMFDCLPVYLLHAFRYPPLSNNTLCSVPFSRASVLVSGISFPPS